MYTLDQAVREYMIEKGDSTEHSYPRLLQLGINGLRQLNMDTSGIPKMVTLPVNDNLTVDLPSDYINYVRIGICFKGEIVSLGRNDKLCIDKNIDECGNSTRRGTTATSTYGFLGDNNFAEAASNHFRNSEFIGRFFGLGGGTNDIGYYRIDHNTNTIQLSSDTSVSEIVLEYISDLSMTDGSYTVHPFVLETLKAYMAWADLRRRKNTPKQDSELARRDYFNELRLSQQRFSSVNIAEAYQALRTGVKLSPKM